MAASPVLGTSHNRQAHGVSKSKERKDLIEILKDPPGVEQNTEAIFRLLLKKPESDELGLRLVLPTDIEGDGVPNEAGDANRRSFDGLGVGQGATPVYTTHRHPSENAGRLKIVGHGASGPLQAVKEHSAEHPRAEEHEDKSELYEEVATLLGNIGDEFSSQFERDAVFQQEMLKCANEAASQAAYQFFETTVDALLDSHRGHLPDTTERTQVAFVFLCMKTALSLANKSITAASDQADIILKNAVKYVGDHFPRWIGTAID